ncbi:hypothetical protein BH23VER1_BH23VER1_34730 [soil metagenome]
MSIRQRARQFQKPGRLVFLLVLTVTGGVLLLASAIVLGIMIVQRDTGYGLLFLKCLAGYILVRITTYIYAVKVRCPLCHGPVFHQKRCTMHRDAHKIGPLSYRLSAIVDALSVGIFTCMYCGTPFRLRK